MNSLSGLGIFIIILPPSPYIYIKYSESDVLDVYEDKLLY